MDRRQLRKQNQFQNKANQPAPPTNKDGTLGERDRNTGKRQARLDNGGEYQVKELFDASTSQTTEVQLNPQTRTADWKESPTPEDPPAITQGKQEIQGRLGTATPDNPNFGNCNVCQGNARIDLDCYSGLAGIDFEEGESEDIITPGYVTFGNKIKYLTNEGKYGEKCFNECTPNSTIAELIASEDIDPETLEYECVVRGYEIARKYRVIWTTIDGDEVYIENRYPIGYAIESGDESAGYEPGDRNADFEPTEETPEPETGLVYDSGIPRKFTVDPGGLSSGNGAYFQIYRYKETPCQYDIVAVTVNLQYYECSDKLENLATWETIYTGECGFEITLGDGLREDGGILRIYNTKGELLFETFDYDPETLEGGTYDGETISDPVRDDDYSSLIKFEKTISADTEGGVKVTGVNCVLGDP